MAYSPLLALDWLWIDTARFCPANGYCHAPATWHNSCSATQFDTYSVGILPSARADGSIGVCYRTCNKEHPPYR